MGVAGSHAHALANSPQTYPSAIARPSDPFSCSDGRRRASASATDGSSRSRLRNALAAISVADREAATPARRFGGGASEAYAAPSGRVVARGGARR